MSAKGIKTDKYPTHWIKRQNINEDDDEDTIERKNFLNEVCADKKPYFFKYRYSNCKYEYEDYIFAKEIFCQSEFGKSLEEILKTEIDLLSTEEQDFVNRYYKYVPLIDYNSPMNKICHHMENNLKEIKPLTRFETPERVISLLRTNQVQDKEKIEIMKKFCREYFEQRKDFKASQILRGLNKTESDFSSIEQYYCLLREKIINCFDSEEEAVNVAVEVCYIQNYRQSKSFIWNILGKELLKNIIKNSTEKPSVLKLDNNGEIEYLFKKYKEVEVNLDDCI